MCGVFLQGVESPDDNRCLNYAGRIAVAPLRARAPPVLALLGGADVRPSRYTSSAATSAGGSMCGLLTLGRRSSGADSAAAEPAERHEGQFAPSHLIMLQGGAQTMAPSQHMQLDGAASREARKKAASLCMRTHGAVRVAAHLQVQRPDAAPQDLRKVDVPALPEALCSAGTGRQHIHKGQIPTGCPAEGFNGGITVPPMHDHVAAP